MSDDRSEKGQVFSIRFSQRELQALRALAARDDVRISDLVRAAIAEYMAANRDPVVDIDAPAESRVYIYTGAPAASETETRAISPKWLEREPATTTSR